MRGVFYHGRRGWQDGMGWDCKKGKDLLDGVGWLLMGYLGVPVSEH